VVDLMDKKSLSEQDIRTKFITPAITKVGWDPMTQLLSQVTRLESTLTRRESTRTQLLTASIHSMLEG
jgi:type I restriction enzyme R subunit